MPAPALEPEPASLNLRVETEVAQTEVASDDDLNVEEWDEEEGEEEGQVVDRPDSEVEGDSSAFQVSSTSAPASASASASSKQPSYLYGFDDDLWVAWRSKLEGGIAGPKEMTDDVFAPNGAVPDDHPVLAKWGDQHIAEIKEMTVGRLTRRAPEPQAQPCATHPLKKRPAGLKRPAAATDNPDSLKSTLPDGTAIVLKPNAQKDRKSLWTLRIGNKEMHRVQDAPKSYEIMKRLYDEAVSGEISADDLVPKLRARKDKLVAEVDAQNTSSKKQTTNEQAATRAAAKAAAKAAPETSEPSAEAVSVLALLGQGPPELFSQMFADGT